MGRVGRGWLFYGGLDGCGRLWVGGGKEGEEMVERLGILARSCASERLRFESDFQVDDSMRRFTIQITREDTNATSTILAEFEDYEVQRLQSYFRYAQRLSELSIVQSGNFGSLNMKMKENEQPTFEVALPQRELISALLHELRRFILHREPTSFNNTVALINRRIRDPLVRSLMDRYRRIYDGRELQSLIVITTNETTLNSQEMLETWLNACGEYHENAQERLEFQRLHELFPENAAKYVMLLVLSDRLKAVMNVAGFVGLLLGEVQTFEARANPNE